MKRSIYGISLVLAVLLMRSLVTSTAAAASNFSGWSWPVNLGPLVNSPFNDFAPPFPRTGGACTSVRIDPAPPVPPTSGSRNATVVTTRGASR